MEVSFYSILGIEKDCSQEDIKKAYRKKAVIWHPDRNPSKEATEKFQDISFAYKILYNPKTREKYDAGDWKEYSGSTEDALDIFKEVFGESGNFEQFFGGKIIKDTTIEKGEDIKCVVEIRLEETLTGCSRTADIERDVECKKCAGTGKTEKSEEVVCTVCKGTGKIIAAIGSSFSQDCPNCGGRGKVIKNPCSCCRGSGVVRETSTVTLKIPAGVQHGNRLKNAGGGNVGKNGGESGNLYIEIEVVPHNIYTVAGKNILCDVALPYDIAVLGGQIALPTLTGDTKIVNIPAGTQGGASIIVPQEGLRSLKSEERGDAIVKVNIKVPAEVSSKQEKLLRAYADSFSITSS